MESFDQSLKYLLQHEPADFIRFGLRDPTVQILRPVPSGLPSRGRDVDGGYVIVRAGVQEVAHIEFHRRHQSAQDLAVDVAEAQIRLFRREGLKVLSLVWDLYAKEGEPMVAERTLQYGASLSDSGSHVVYVRVNLRALPWDELLSQGPRAFWPLVALSREGASETAVHKARDAIEARADLSPAEQTDHLAVLWFVAEGENVPIRIMKAYISEERLMASELYQSIFEKGQARAKADLYADTIIKLLIHRLGALDPSVRERIRSLADVEILKAWHDEVLFLDDAQGAERLAEKIRKAPLP